ncbi:flagellar basal body rod protein FlgB [Nitratireductor sp. XY-223]|uniref:flagellar basal body rod protein FlgB n=1 Tax=Nitratireductor sp. XY-223 TaxID=2561926 RepID=UPI0010AA041B|nr:flagellar basal body rod protein FlgB [Nitratireductor sp. XY-223]
MEPIQLFELASDKAHWLSVRQSVVAGNIANANTPDYVAMDIDPFETVLDTVGTQMAATHPAHLTEDPLRGSVRAGTDQGFDIAPSGNAVSLEEELIKAGEIRKEYELSTGLLRSFHRMMLLTVAK